MAYLNKRVILQGVAVLSERMTESDQWGDEFAIDYTDSYDIQAMVDELNKLLVEGKQ